MLSYWFRIYIWSGWICLHLFVARIWSSCVAAVSIEKIILKNHPTFMRWWQCYTHLPVLSRELHARKQNRETTVHRHSGGRPRQPRTSRCSYGSAAGAALAGVAPSMRTSTSSGVSRWQTSPWRGFLSFDLADAPRRCWPRRMYSLALPVTMGVPAAARHRSDNLAKRRRLGRQRYRGRAAAGLAPNPAPSSARVPLARLVAGLSADGRAASRHRRVARRRDPEARPPPGGGASIPCRPPPPIERTLMSPRGG
jgi:hypothetical protein